MSFKTTLTALAIALGLTGCAYSGIDRSTPKKQDQSTGIQEPASQPTSQPASQPTSQPASQPTSQPAPVTLPLIEIIRTEVEKSNLPKGAFPYMVAVFREESLFDVNATSRMGAAGLTQMLPLDSEDHARKHPYFCDGEGGTTLNIHNKNNVKLKLRRKAVLRQKAKGKRQRRWRSKSYSNYLEHRYTRSLKSFRYDAIEPFALGYMNSFITDSSTIYNDVKLVCRFNGYKMKRYLELVKEGKGHTLFKKPKMSRRVRRNKRLRKRIEKRHERKVETVKNCMAEIASDKHMSEVNRLLAEEHSIYDPWVSVPISIRFFERNIPRCGKYSLDYLKRKEAAVENEKNPRKKARLEKKLDYLFRHAFGMANACYNGGYGTVYGGWKKMKPHNIDRARKIRAIRRKDISKRKKARLIKKLGPRFRKNNAAHYWTIQEGSVTHHAAHVRRTFASMGIYSRAPASAFTNPEEFATYRRAGIEQFEAQLVAQRAFFTYTRNYEVNTSPCSSRVTRPSKTASTLPKNKGSAYTLREKLQNK